MRQFLRSLLLAVTLIGIIALIFGVYQYLDSRNTLSNTPTIESLATTLDVNNPTNQQIIALTEMKRRDAVRQQNRSIIIAGGGLIAVGVGWMGYALALKPKSVDA